MLGDTFLLPVPKPPIFAHAFAASAVARNFTNASIAGLSRNVTKMSPPTKSPSSTIAAFGGEPNAFVTESLKLYVSAPDVPPARFDELPITCAIVFRAFVTDESVHLILCSLRALYFAGPNVRR